MTPGAGERPGVAGLILAAGRASRFGAVKLLAPLAGRPVLDHVLAASAASGLDRVLVVLPPGADGDALEGLVASAGADSIRNQTPELGLSTSVRLGVDTLAADPSVATIVVLPGDQPLVRPAAIRAVVDAVTSGARPIAIARHADGSPNPVALRREAFGLLDDVEGDRGFGPVLEANRESVTEVRFDAPNPDVDTPADLLAADWALRVRANRDQVDRVREIPDGADFYAPVSRLFRADPDRTGDEVLDALVALVRPDDVVLDVGAGAGRYALPLARRVREVVAVDPSASMLDALVADAETLGIANVRTIAGRWPPSGADDPLASLRPDVSLVAHLGYDIEAIGPFLDALERQTRRVCVAVLMARSPASGASPFWPPVHGEERDELPALDELVALVRARGGDPEVSELEVSPRGYESLADAQAAVEQQLWVAPGGVRHGRFLGELRERTVERDGRWYLHDVPRRLGIVRWTPAHG